MKNQLITLYYYINKLNDKHFIKELLKLKTFHYHKKLYLERIDENNNIFNLFLLNFIIVYYF